MALDFCDGEGLYITVTTDCPEEEETCTNKVQVYMADGEVAPQVLGANSCPGKDIYIPPAPEVDCGGCQDLEDKIEELAFSKQDRLTAGNGIEIENNVITSNPYQPMSNMYIEELLSQTF